ncbi:MAG: DUF2917 domain-containing protein [Burkholderiales bacterium]|nr:DUF2917 domain-containing protein [Burkholderiales bacterium]
MREWNQDTLQVQRAWVALQTGDSLLLRGAPGLRVEAAAPPCSGQQAPLLWLTEEGEADDVFLRPGESHVLRGRGRTVASAWGPINLRVVALASPQARLTPPILRRLDAHRSAQRMPRSASRPSVGSAWLRV